MTKCVGSAAEAPVPESEQAPAARSTPAQTAPAQRPSILRSLAMPVLQQVLWFYGTAAFWIKQMEQIDIVGVTSLEWQWALLTLRKACAVPT